MSHNITYKNPFLALLFLCSILIAQTKTNASFTDFTKQFIKQYTEQGIRPLQISYVANLEGIKTHEQLEQQTFFFKQVKAKLQQYDSNSLSKSQILEYKLIAYETNLNLHRISLEKNWRLNANTAINNNGIYHQSNGKQWYAYLLKRWVDNTVTPDAMFQFGLDEIEKVKASMLKIRLSSGLKSKDFEAKLSEPSFFLNNSNAIENKYNTIKKLAQEKVADYFPYTNDIRKVDIAKGTNESLAHVPAFYNNSTFYFNHFGDPYNIRQMAWTYMHEGVPGHHYQAMITQKVKRSPVQDLFFYYGFVEGWAAYIEQYGKQIGVYNSIYDEYGKWEWDLIRSVRVSLDVGLNYYGWTDEKALKFWQKHIQNQDDIAQREISRMKRWPAQVITYKYGAKVINELKRNIKAPPDLKIFHEQILQHGDIPLSVLKTIF